MINNWFSETWVNAVGWTLIHSIWQIVLVSMLCFLLLRLFHERSAAFRYNLMVAGLGISILLMGLTVVAHWQEPTAAEVPITIDQELSGTALPLNVPQAEVKQRLHRFLQDQLFTLVLLWLVGVFLFSLRLIGAYAFLTHLRFWGVEEVSNEWKGQFERLKKRMDVKRKVLFVGSLLVKEPATFGHFKPIILFPISFFTHLDPTQVEALILHELAHIKRRDFLINFLQSILEMILFYHPGIWWMSKMIRELREECCDDLVLDSGVERVSYAEALLTVHKHFSIQPKIKLAMKTSGNSTHLGARIRRLINAEASISYWRLRFSRVILMTTIGVLFLVLGACTSMMVTQGGPVSVAADKMNVFYLGVDNPITVAVAGVPDEKVALSSDDVDLTAMGAGKYNAKPRELGEARIKVIPEGGAAREVVFRVKRIPDPIARVGKTTGGTYPADQFKTATSVNIFLSNFDFDVNCEVVSFNIVRVGEKEDPVEVINRGENFDERAQKLIQMASPGDVYYFDEVVGQCPGDVAVRKLNSMVFKLK